MNRVTATFSIWSQDLRPEKISEILCFEPDRTVLKGVERTPPRRVPAAFGWHVHCQKTDVDFPPAMMKLLVGRLHPVLEKMKRLRDLDPGLDVQFHLSIAPKTTDLSLYFDKDDIDAIANFGGILDIDFFDL